MVIFGLIILLNPLYFFSKCFRINLRNKLIKFIKCFDFNNNIKEILGKEQYDYGSNLNLIYGIRGIALMAIVVSCTFFYIYHLPTKDINEIYLKNLFKNSAFPLIYHGVRFGKNILYAISGLELTCKMIHYLDDFLKKKQENSQFQGEHENKEFLLLKEEEDEEDDLEREEKNEKNNIITVKLDNIGNSMNDEGEDEDDEEEKNYLNNNYLNIQTKREGSFLQGEEEEGSNKREITNDNLPIKPNLSESLTFKNNSFYYENYRKKLDKKVLINWYIRQSYKYLLFIVIIIYYKYGTIYMFYISDYLKPIWILYFTEISKKFTTLQILANLFLFSPFSYKTFNWIDPFGIVYNEITFFIIGSLLIFVCYKYCFRLDIIILTSFFVLTSLKIILGIFVFIPNGYYPAMFYQYDGKNEKLGSYLLSNQLMNLNIFLLGMFFGEIHYCIYYEESKSQNKKYINLAMKLMIFFKKFIFQKKLLRSMIIQFLLLLLLAGYIYIVCIYKICINKYMNNGNNFFTNKKFNIISLFDSDIAIVVLLFILLILFFQRNKMLTKFLEHKYWRIISVPYWSHILFLHIVTSYIFYLSEKRIKLLIYTVVFISCQVLLFLVLITNIIFVLVEMPLKNITKKFLKI